MKKQLSKTTKPLSKKRIGVIGLGQWGPNHVRNFFFHSKTDVRYICDKDTQRLAANRDLYPGVSAVTDYRQVTRAVDVDAVVIATPVSSHFAIAKDALSHGKDVFCEKPLTFKRTESETLVKLAKAKKRILMIGYVFLFNPGILRLKEFVTSKECGRHYYLHAERTNLGPVRSDVNAVYDLASHDIAILNFLLDAQPKVINAVGQCYLQPGVEDVAFVSLEYPNKILAHIHVSWLDPKKVREITLIGKQKMVTWNDLKLNGPLEVYSKRVERAHFYKDYGEFHLLVKEGEVVTPYVRNVEPLKLQTDHFIDCITRRKKPLADGETALKVARVLEDIEGLLAKRRSPK